MMCLVSKVIQWVRHPKPDSLNSFSGAHVMKITGSHKLSSGLHIHPVVYMHKYENTYTHNKYILLKNIMCWLLKALVLLSWKLEFPRTRVEGET